MFQNFHKDIRWRGLRLPINESFTDVFKGERILLYLETAASFPFKYYVLTIPTGWLYLTVSILIRNLYKGLKLAMSYKKTYTELYLNKIHGGRKSI